MSTAPTRRRHWAASLAAVAAIAAVAPSVHAAEPPLADGGPVSPAACKPGAKLGDGQAAALQGVLIRARSGVVVPPGAIDPPSLAARRPAEVLVRLGPDPLGLAAALSVEPARFWATAGADVVATGPGFSARGRIQADGSVRLRFTPPSAGPVRMRMYVPGKSIERVVGAPVGCGVSAALVRPGNAPGSPVLEVADQPDPAPDPGGEPSPVPAPVPGPEPQP